MIYEEPIAPTVEAIEAWRAQEEANKPEGAVFATEYDHYGVNVWTKAGSCRCIVGQLGKGIDSSGRDRQGWWTIRGEGSSNGGRETWVYADAVVRAVGVIVGERDPRVKAEELIRFEINGVEILAPVDPTPWPIKDFERSRDYVTKSADGTEYLLTIAASGYLAHPIVDAAEMSVR